MITQDQKCYLFREGYIRMSGYKYCCDTADDPESRAIHLTNNAIQKYD